VSRRSLAEDEPHTVVRYRDRNYYYTVVGEAQSTEGKMKMLFLAITTCLVFSLSSSAQAQKAKFSDQYCAPYCTGHCADVLAGRTQPFNHNPAVKIEDTPVWRQACMSKCLPMCRELGH
jgi:hypothetical protein